MRNIVVFNSVFIISLFFATSCSSNANSKPQEMIHLKYPVVFVHGIVAHDRDSPVAFWGRIPDTLRSHGVNIFFGNTDAWGTYESNATILKDTIENVLAQTQAERVNIIAHSKGGIDSRYLIWNYDFGDKVASLTTISTPHHGAELADFIANRDIIYTETAMHIISVFGQLYGDRYPNLYAVLYELTTENMAEFNQKVLQDEMVYYQSLYTAMNRPLDDALFSRTYAYIYRVGGPNDGVVSAKSATWGSNARRIVRNGISHTQIVDIQKRSVDGVDTPSLYIDILRDLSLKGF